MIYRKLGIKALLIDLDGTLVDSTEAYREAGKAGFAAVGLGHSDVETAIEVARRLERGLPVGKVFRELEDENKRQRFLSAYLDAYYLTVQMKSKLLPDVEETLEKLGGHFPLALITLRHVRREQVEGELKRLNIGGFFKAIVTALDVKKPKPFPDALQTAANRLDVSIHACAIVGDSIVDIQAGKSAGCRTIAVLSGLFSKEELKKKKPDLVVTSISLLPDKLGL